MSIVNSVHYVAGKRAPSGGGDQGFTWVGLLRPTDAELEDIAERFEIHPLAMAAVGRNHLRSTIEQYGDDTVLVVRAARYLDDPEVVEFGELHVFVSGKALVTVRLAEEPDLAQARVLIEERPDLLARGPRAALWAVLNAVVETYDPVVDGLENDIDEIEDQIFSDDPAEHISQRIYELHREVIGFQRAAKPLEEVVDQLRESAAEDDPDVELRRLYRDLHGHLVRISDRIENFRALLDNALQAHAAIVSQRQTQVSLDQTEQTKKISAWAAILYLPSMIGAIYGMNFQHMPELHWLWGYPFALGIMVASSLGLYGVFKKVDWI